MISYIFGQSPGLGEDRSRIPVGRIIFDFDRLIKCRGSENSKNGAENFFLGDFHIRCDKINHCRSNVITVFLAFHRGVPAVHQNFGPLCFRLRDVAFNPFFCLLGDDGAQILAGNNLFGLFTEPVNDGVYLSHRYHGRSSHASLTGASRHGRGYV